MKIPKTNLNKFSYLNLLILPTWYPIFISHILPSLVHSLCPDHAVALVSYLCTLSNRDSFINFLVYSVYLFSFSPSFYAPYKISFQTFGFLFHLLIFLLIYLNTIKNEIQKKTTKPLY